MCFFFIMNVLFFQWEQKNTPKSLGYELALEVDEGYMSLHVDFQFGHCLNHPAARTTWHEIWQSIWPKKWSHI
jgi:hypothetical protein